MLIPPLSDVGSARGAPMGRPDQHVYPADQPGELRPVLALYRLRFEDGAYDEGGAYWGAPATVWRVYGEVEIDGAAQVIDFYLRADNRAKAVAGALQRYPLATFEPARFSDTHALLVKGMALAFFGSAYADQADECGQSLAGEIMNQLPEQIDPSAMHAAITLSFDMERVNGDDIETLYTRHPGSTDDPQDWGHYAAMQAMGHGVGLRDYGISDEQVKVPYTEFGSHSLQQDYFTPPDEEDEA